ncbi:MAG: class I SAM-dependent methyltransferase, partial [Clostridia bacterium]|nr:class I SAM-dependent methyltransferase [Clostridia bacterium]
MKNLLSEGAKTLDISLNDVQLDNFIKYMELLLEWNENVNLTAITDPGEVITKHFLDSLTALNLIPDGASVADIGCGAGF